MFLVFQAFTYCEFQGAFAALAAAERAATAPRLGAPEAPHWSWSVLWGVLWGHWGSPLRMWSPNHLPLLARVEKDGVTLLQDGAQKET